MCCIILKARKIIVRTTEVLFVESCGERILKKSNTVDHLRRITDEINGEEQCGFWTGVCCVEQMFVLRQVVKKACERGRNVYMAF